MLFFGNNTRIVYICKRLDLSIDIHYMKLIPAYKFLMYPVARTFRLALLLLVAIVVGCGKPDKKFVIAVSQCSEDVWRDKLNEELKTGEYLNHLDIQSIQWLEQFLMQSAKAVVLVSHDRAFINNVTNRTLEISCGKVIDYRVKYNEYVQLRKERREQQLRAY